LLVWSKWPGVGRFANAGFCLLNCRFARCATPWDGSPPDIARVLASTLASARYLPRRARVWFSLPNPKRVRGQLLGSLNARGTFGRFGWCRHRFRAPKGKGTPKRLVEANGRSFRNAFPESATANEKPFSHNRFDRERTADPGDERTRSRATRDASSDCSAAPQRAVRLVEVLEAWAGAARCPAG
jgi:hypothetical protein